MEQVEAAPTAPGRDDEYAILPLLTSLRGKNGDDLRDVDLRDELKALITAGHETTAMAIAWAPSSWPTILPCRRPHAKRP